MSDQEVLDGPARASRPAADPSDQRPAAAHRGGGTGPTGAARARRQGWRRLAGRIAARTALAVAVAWLAFVVAHLVVSGRTWWWAPADAMPPILLLAVPVALAPVAALARPVRGRMAAVLAAAAALGAGGSGVNVATLWHDAPPAPPSAITVVTWNTEFWDQDHRAGGRGFEPGFYRFLRDLDADVYLLKEYLYLDDSAPDVFAKTVPIDRAARLRQEFPGYEIAVDGEQLTLSRLPVVGHTGLDIRPWLPVDLREVPAPLRDAPESYTVETQRVDIRVGGDVVSFYNAHVHQPPHELLPLRAGQRESNRYNHSRRVASYQALRADVAANRRPVVLAGDLNTSPAMGMLRDLPAGLVDHTAALPELYPWTWMVGGLPLWQIDWVLSTPDVAVHRYEYLDPAGLSDHRVQRVVLSTTGRTR